MQALDGEKAKLHSLIDLAWLETAEGRRLEFYTFMVASIRVWQESDVPNIGPSPA
jgi:hypothetical protein